MHFGVGYAEAIGLDIRHVLARPETEHVELLVDKSRSQSAELAFDAQP